MTALSFAIFWAGNFVNSFVSLTDEAMSEKKQKQVEEEDPEIKTLKLNNKIFGSEKKPDSKKTGRNSIINPKTLTHYGPGNNVDSEMSGIQKERNQRYINQVQGLGHNPNDTIEGIIPKQKNPPEYTIVEPNDPSMEDHSGEFNGPPANAIIPSISLNPQLKAISNPNIFKDISVNLRMAVPPPPESEDLDYIQNQNNQNSPDEADLVPANDQGHYLDEVPPENDNQEYDE